MSLTSVNSSPALRGSSSMPRVAHVGPRTATRNAVATVPHLVGGVGGYGGGGGGGGFSSDQGVCYQYGGQGHGRAFPSAGPMPPTMREAPRRAPAASKSPPSKSHGGVPHGGGVMEGGIHSPSPQEPSMETPHIDKQLMATELLVNESHQQLANERIASTEERISAAAALQGAKEEASLAVRKAREWEMRAFAAEARLKSIYGDQQKGMRKEEARIAMRLEGQRNALAAEVKKVKKDAQHESLLQIAESRRQGTETKVSNAMHAAAPRWRAAAPCVRTLSRVSIHCATGALSCTHAHPARFSHSPLATILILLTLPHPLPPRSPMGAPRAAARPRAPRDLRGGAPPAQRRGQPAGS